MAHSQLPERASLEYLKKVARDRLAEMRRADPGAKLAAALLDVARDHGFPSWRALKKEVERRREHAASRFFDACRAGDADAVRELLTDEPALARMVDPKGQYPGWTGLHYAARDGRLDVARLLLEHGADPNAREAGDQTYPLHWAAAHRAIEVVRALLDAGGDPHGVGDLHELDAIGWATYFHPDGGKRGDQPQVAQLLVERGAQHHVFSAMSLGDPGLLRNVVEQDPGALDRRLSRFENRLSAVHFAVTEKRHDLLALLIELGADIEAVDGNAHTPLEAAIFAADRESVRRLQAAGALPPPPSRPAPASLAEFTAEVRRITPMLRVPDVGRALTWYLSLGFTERGRYEESGVLYWAMLAFGNAELMLNLGSTGEDPPVTLWFYVERTTAIYEALKARQMQAAQSADGNDVEFVQHLHEPHYGGREFTIRDLNGYSLTFLGPA
jgi:ankyrin repeat protein